MQPIRGVVLETFGAGNAPQRADIADALKDACDRGVIIVAISQCTKGSVSDAYESGRVLLQLGIVPGGDMTPEVCSTFLGGNPILTIFCSVRSQNSATCYRSRNSPPRK